MEVLIFWLLFAFITAVAASARGRNWFGWFLLGMLFSFFALILVLVLPSLNQAAEATPAAHKPAPMAPRAKSGLYCSACGAPVTMRDKFCHSCGANLAADR
jgi:hypothetical protein